MNELVMNELVIQAAKFLKEVEQQAFNNVKATILPIDNKIGLSGLVWYDQKNITGESTVTFYVTLIVNGKEIKLEGQAKTDDQLETNPTVNPIIVMVYKELSKILSDELIKHIDYEFKKVGNVRPQ